MKKDFKEYLEKLEGMDRIELILDLLVDKKINKDQAVVLISGDKSVNIPPKITITQPTWTYGSSGTNITNPYLGNTTLTSTYTGSES